VFKLDTDTGIESEKGSAKFHSAQNFPVNNEGPKKNNPSAEPSQDGNFVLSPDNPSSSNQFFYCQISVTTFL
jgi:hypothetical protein